MTGQQVTMDIVLYGVLVAGIVVYGVAIGRHMDESGDDSASSFDGAEIPARHIASRFRRYSILLVSYLMLVGVLHQAGICSSVATGILFAIGAAALLFGLVVLRRYIH